MNVRQLMTSQPLTLHDYEPVPRAAELMRLARVRHLPVVDHHGTLVGLVTHRDLLRAQAREPAPRVDEVMTTGVKTVSPDTPALMAARMLLQHQFGCLLVLERGALVGIVTEADFVKWAVRQLGHAEAARPAQARS